MSVVQKNAANPEDIKAQEKRLKRQREQELSDMERLVSTVEGRRFLWRLLGFCRVNESSFDMSGSKMYFNEGIRNVGLKLLADLHGANPDAYVIMMKEAKGRELNGE